MTAVHHQRLRLITLWLVSPALMVAASVFLRGADLKMITPGASLLFPSIIEHGASFEPPGFPAIKAIALDATKVSLNYSEYTPAYLSFDPDRRVPFTDNAAYTLNTWDWAVDSDTNALRLWLNGVEQPNTEANGVASVMLKQAWCVQPHASNQIVAVLDYYGFAHAYYVGSVVRATAPGVKVLEINSGYGSAEVGSGISNAVSLGARIMALPFDFTDPSRKPTNTLSAIAAFPDVLFVTAAINSNIPEATSGDWMANSGLSNVICVNVMAKDGSRYQSGYGPAVFIGADGRRVIVSKGGTNYSGSGTSFAAPRVAGVLALLLERGCSTAEAQRRIALTGEAWGANSSHGSLNAWAAAYWNGSESRTLSLNLSNGINRVEWSTDLVNWEPFTLRQGLGTMRIPVGNEAYRFWRTVQ